MKKNKKIYTQYHTHTCNIYKVSCMKRYVLFKFVLIKRATAVHALLSMHCWVLGRRNSTARCRGTSSRSSRRNRRKGTLEWFTKASKRMERLMCSGLRHFHFSLKRTDPFQSLYYMISFQFPFQFPFQVWSKRLTTIISISQKVWQSSSQASPGLCWTLASWKLDVIYLWCVGCGMSLNGIGCKQSVKVIEY